MPKIIRKKQNTADLLVDRFIIEKAKLDALPPLSDLDRTTFDLEQDVAHLYFSSKIEGSVLTKSQIGKAVHGTAENQ